ncbi:tRNA-guanine(15) transglycosylase-like protein [Schizophyllum commune]
MAAPATVEFTLLERGEILGPRLGTFVKRSKGHPDSNAVEIATPGLIAMTSRGVVPHLSRDHARGSEAVRWVHVPFESFLEHVPPVPTLQKGADPLHAFLGFPSERHIVSMALRDPHDAREMPPNTAEYVTARCVRGVRRVTPAQWKSYVTACAPDIVLALPDIPFTAPPHSQKRQEKSIARTAQWAAQLLAPDLPRMNVLVQMAGGASAAARRAFADNLREELYDKEAEAIAPHKCIDDGLLGYVFDLEPLRLAVAAEGEKHGKGRESDAPAAPFDAPAAPIQAASALRPDLAPLLCASLERLPSTKPRIAHSSLSPREMLRLIQRVGIDLFDAHWAQRAADVGIALDFTFPAPEGRPTPEGLKQPTDGGRGLRAIGHNLYDEAYAHDFSAFSSNLPDCPCITCAPHVPTTRIVHSGMDEPAPNAGARLPSYTHAYLHHLLHTHEMSAHSLLVVHNLAVLDAFFAGVRSVLGGGGHDYSSLDTEAFAREVDRFEATYDGDLAIFEEARARWMEVDRARGKGRLAREKVKQQQATLGTAVALTPEEA